MQVDPGRLSWLLDSGAIPVLSAECLLPDERTEQARPHEVVGAITKARDVACLDVLTEAERISRDGLEALTLNVSDIERMISRGSEAAPDGALLAVQAALDSGAPAARVGSLNSLLTGTATEVR